jgi:type VI secretion system protein ImpG
MFAKYYQDELAWLREMGAELATQRPDMARFLAEPGADPDVERLLEGFAFLTGRIREKLDDEFPELTHGFMDMFCPHYLRPIPSMAILQVAPKPTAKSAGSGLLRGSQIDSVPVDGTRCRFQTVADIALAPVSLTDVEFTAGHSSKLSLHLRARARGGLASLGDKPLRLHLTGDTQVSRALFVALGKHVAQVRVQSTSGDGAATTANVTIQPGGLGESEAALDIPAGTFRGFRLLQEYFAFPERFMFLDIQFHDTAGIGGDVRLDFEFQELPDEMPPVNSTNVLLDCVPIINLFAHDADPLRAQAGRTEYRIRPAGQDAQHYEVNSVTSVSGRMRGAAKQETYRSFFTFDARDRTAGRFYQLHRRDSLRVAGTDVYVRLGAEDPEMWSALDTISVEVMCSNRDLPSRLRPGDICEPTPSAPGSYVYRSIGKPSAPIAPPIGDEVHWRLLSHMTLNLRRMSDVDSLRTTLALYDFRARSDRQARRRLDNLLAAISSSQCERSVELLDGIPITGSAINIAIDEKKAGGEGETFLFGTILNEFLAQYVSLNSFAKLSIHCTDNNEVFTWPARVGRRNTL